MKFRLVQCATLRFERSRFYSNAAALLAVLLAGLDVAAWQQDATGVELTLTQKSVADPALLRIEVAAENIFRVIAAPGAQISARPSLIVENWAWPAVEFSATEHDGLLRISTAQLAAEVTLASGAIVFEDAAGKAILRERNGGGKMLQAAEVMGEQTWHAQQIFTSPPDEAFYGLGQHQDGWMNYKGRSLELAQSNLVAAVPFLVSSRNYGILWDNNSRLKFGDSREFAPLSILQLYDQAGKPGGLTAEYFGNGNFSSKVALRNESDFEYGSLQDRKNFPQGFDPNRGSVVWSGAIESPESGVHQFRLYCSAHTKMWLGGKLAVDCWRQNWMPWQRIIELDMQPGRQYPLRIEWQSAGGYIGLRCRTPQPEKERSQLTLTSDVADQIDYYFIRGNNLDEVIGGYRSLTGRAPLPPKWALGFWQSRERYKTQKELLDTGREYRKRGLPLDNLVQDWFYWREDQWGSHEFDPARFPDPAGMVRQAHEELHAQVMISVWPKFYVGTKNYDAFQKQGWLYPRNVEAGERDWVGKGYVSTFYDPYSAGSRELFWNQIDERLFRLEFDAWWLDATEPDIHSNLSPEEYLLRIGPTALGSAARYRNSYSLMNAKGIYEGQRQAAPDQRVFILTRSAWAGQQRYAAATWSGDIATRWSDLAEQIPAGLNFSISGIPYWSCDIGGFAVEPRFMKAEGAILEEWRELQTRWFQFGAFCPVFRSHGSNLPREIYEIAPEEHPAYAAMARYDRLRYRLLPYIYSLAGMVTHEGYTIMRPLAMDFPADPRVRDIPDQYMFGPTLLINPVTEYKARRRLVFLPAGTIWHDLWNGTRYQGGLLIWGDAPYGDIPIFARVGSIIPCGPALQYTDEKPADPLRLLVFTGADGAFTLYEDEGVNNAYEQGKFSRIPFSYSAADKMLTIGERAGEFPGMLKSRTFEVSWIAQNSGGLNFELPADKIVEYTGKEIKLHEAGR